MSVVVAVKKDNVVYMGADTLYSRGDRGERVHNEVMYKINVTEQGVLVGTTGSASIGQALFYGDAFVVPEEGLTKKYIVQNVIPRIEEILDEKKLWVERENGKIDTGIAIVLAYKDQLFYIGSSLLCMEVSSYLALGAGQGYATPVVVDGLKKGKDVNDVIVEGVKMAEKLSRSVGGDITLIDTKDLKFNVVEGL